MAVTVSILIEAPLDVVWRAAADLGSHSEWMVDAESIQFLNSQRQGVGTRMEVLTRIGPISTTDVMEVIAWEPPRQIRVRHDGLVSGVGEFRLDPVAGGVALTWSEKLRFPWRLGGPLGALLAQPILFAVWKRNLKRLRTQIVGDV